MVAQPNVTYIQLLVSVKKMRGFWLHIMEVPKQNHVVEMYMVKYMINLVISKHQLLLNKVLLYEPI